MTEKDVQAFFLDENGQLNKSHTYKKAITTALQVNLEDSDVQRIMNFVPEIKKIRTLYQFLTVKECERIKQELMNNHFSLRDKAMLNILFYYGIRACDVANLKLENIDWQKDKISLYQSKTLNLVELPLLPIVGNSIYDYIKYERPQEQSNFLFLKSFSPVGNRKEKLTQPAIAKRIKKYAVAGSAKSLEIPMNLHSHQLRHAKATHWLEDGMNIVQIKFLLGHESVETTMKYLDVSIDEKAKALATLEDEKVVSLPKKWKLDDGSLSEFLGLPR